MYQESSESRSTPISGSPFAWRSRIAGCASVTMYWCSTGMTGMSSPTIAPVRRAKLPEAKTRCSQVISPLSVVTSHSPEGVFETAVTVVFRLISAPIARAPWASAWVRSAGWM